MPNATSQPSKTVRLFTWWAVFVLSLLLPTHADAAVAPSVTTQDLRTFGVKNLDEFHPVFMSPDGRKVYFWEQFTRDQRAQGDGMAALWEFRFRADGVLAEHKRFPLSIPRINQVALMPDGTGAVVMAREGSSFWHLDFATGKTREFVTPGVGKTRFLSEPRVMWAEGGRLWTVGYPLTPDTRRGALTLAALNPRAQGDEALVIEKVNLDEVLRLLKPWKMQRFVSPTTGFVAGNLDGKLQACFWKADAGLTPYAQFREILSAWTGDDWEVITGIGPSGTSDAYVHDGTTGKTWTLPARAGEEPYDYPLISRDGGVITIVSGPRAGRTFSVHYGLKKDEYALKPIPGLTKVPAGHLRLSDDGSMLVYRNTTGIYLVGIPK